MDKEKSKVFEKIDLPDVKNIIVIASGKGGVGKSTVAANLAISLSKTGAKTALVDADMYGPSIPIMFDEVNANPVAQDVNGKTMIKPVVKYGIKLLSIGFFMDPKKALIWRGPMVSNGISQLFKDTDWGVIDFMIVDLPPGTGDIHITIVQKLNVTGAIIVTTPQNIALSEIRKTADMFLQDNINVPVLGIIENMSYFTPAELPENKYYIFGKGGGEKISKELNVPLIGQIPIVQSICESGEIGKPIALSNDEIISKIFKEITSNIIKQIK